MLLLAELRFGAGWATQGRQGDGELVTEPLLRPLRQWPGALFCDVMCGDLQHNCHRTVFAQRVVWLFLSSFIKKTKQNKTRLWGNLKARDLKGI